MNLGLNDNSTEDIASDIRPGEAAKTREDDKKNGVGETNNGEEMSFFDCSICLGMAKDPIVTCCGHLFCWPCLYRWLHHHSEAKECPVCKAKVTAKNVTPIYGRGDSNNKGGTDPSLKIPLRPHTRRVKSWRNSEARNLELLEAEGARYLASLDNIAAMLRPTHLPSDEDQQ